MKTIKQRYNDIAAGIADPAQPDKTHYPLLGLLEEINADKSRRFDPQAVSAAGIDPDAFLTSWATGFAKETLGMNGTGHPVWHSVAVSRCKTCLSTEGNHAFGRVLPENFRIMLREKLEKLEPQPNRQASAKQALTLSH